MADPSHYSSRLMHALLRPLVLLLLAGVVLFVLVLMAAKVLFPYLEGWRQDRKIAEARAEVRKALQERKELEREIARYDTAEGPILAARQKGWIKPGEKVIRYAPPQELKPRAARRTDPRQTTLGKWQRAVRRALR